MPDNKDIEDQEQEGQGVPVTSVHITDKETGEELDVVNLPGVHPGEPAEEVKRQGLKAFERLKAAEDSLDPKRIEELSKLMPADELLDLAALELRKGVVPVYLEKLEAVLNDQGVEAIDTSLPHLRAATDKEGEPTVEIVWDDEDSEKIRERLRSLLDDLPDPSVEFTRFAWTHIIAWAADLMEEDLGLKKLEAMTEEEFDDSLHDFMYDKNPEPLEDRLSLLANVWAEGLGRMLVDTVDPASRTLEALEILMGLRPEKAPTVPMDPPLFAETGSVTDYVKTSNAPITEATRQAITKAYKWYPDKDGVPEFAFPQKSGKPIIYGLDWPAQFEPKGELDLAYARREILGEVYTSSLELALEGHAVNHGPRETFYLDGDSLFKALGLPGHLSRGEKLRLVDKHARRVSFLRVSPITDVDYLKKGKGKYRGKPVREYTTREGFVWNIVIERKYQEPLEDMPEAERELAGLVLEVTPGDCWRFFLDKNHPLYFYRHTAAPQLNPYTQYLAALLEPHLEYQCGVNKDRLPWAVKVGTLLEKSLDGTPKRRGGGYYDMAALRTGKRWEQQDVIQQWEEAILTLQDQGWRIGFDPATYPDNLRPAWTLEDKAEEAHREKRRRPKGYWDKLMAAKVFVSWPPDMAAQYPESPQKKRLPPAPNITGARVKAAREKAGLTQAQLADRLGISKSLLGMVEQGRRGTPELLKRISKELDL